jgi:hypothetical protein
MQGKRNTFITFSWVQMCGLADCLKQSWCKCSASPLVLCRQRSASQSRTVSRAKTCKNWRLVKIKKMHMSHRIRWLTPLTNNENSEKASVSILCHKFYVSLCVSISSLGPIPLCLPCSKETISRQEHKSIMPPNREIKAPLPVVLQESILFL